MSALSFSWVKQSRAEQLAFYGDYHRNPVNQLVHVIFVPLIYATVLVWLADVTVAEHPVSLTLADAMSAVYSLYYVHLDPVAGGLWLLFQGIPLLVAAKLVARSLPAGNWHALWLHLLGWVMQFWAHAVHEKKRPALFDSLFQSVGLAPLFVWYHVLNFFGFRKDVKAAMLRQKLKE